MVNRITKTPDDEMPPPIPVTLTRAGLTRKDAIRGHALLTIGRHPSCNLVVRDPNVAPKHFTLQRVPGGKFLVTDLKGSSGTFIAGVQVRSAEIRTGDSIQCGQTLIRIETRNRPKTPEALGGLIGSTPDMQHLFAQIERAAPTDTTVLIHGETGTGKERIAAEIRRLSKRSTAPFQVLDCSTLPHQIAESFLFGQADGSFTGAKAGPGVFEAANGGTVFLDEVGEIPLHLQPKLLQCLGRGRLRRLGSNTEVPLNVRVIAATHRNLHERVAEGRFMASLLHRLDGIPLWIPPLRERLCDIDALVQHYLDRGSFNNDAQGRRRVQRFRPEPLQALRQHHWPGNVRELFNVVEFAVAYANAHEVQLYDLPDELNGRHIKRRRPYPDKTTEAAEFEDHSAVVLEHARACFLLEMERDYLVTLMATSGGDIDQAAEHADMSKRNLFRMLEKHGLQQKTTGQS